MELHQPKLGGACLPPDEQTLARNYRVMELLSRVKALLRRTREEGGKQLQVGAIQLDHDRHVVLAEGNSL